MAFVARTVGEVAQAAGGTVEGDASLKLSGVASLAEADSGDLSFLANPQYVSQLATTKAGAVLVGLDVPAASAPQYRALIRVAKPNFALIKAMECMAPPPPLPVEGVHPSAIVAPTAKLGKNVAVGAFTLVADGAEVGDNTVLHSGVKVGRQVKIGNDCLVYDNAVIYHECVIGNRVIIHSNAVIGSDGFGYEWTGAGFLKIPQVGIVVLEDDVEVGACTTIDRARFGKTVVGMGTKLDNQIQIAHNVKVGRFCAFAAQVGIAGSSEIGDGCMFGGKAGVVGHMKVGPRTELGAVSVVTKNLPGGGRYMGNPARLQEKVLDEWRNIKTIKRLRQEVEALTRRIESIEAQAKDHSH